VRDLVVGTYPPPAQREASRTLETVHRLGARGDTVDVLSTPGSASQWEAPIVGPRGAWHALRRGRNYDAVFVQVERNTPLRTVHGRSGRVARVVDCLAWGLALRLLPASTLVVPDVNVVHRSLGGRTGRFLWTGADRLLVSSDYGRRRLIDEGGVPESSIEVAGPLPEIERHAHDDWAGFTDAAAIMVEVRRRAALDRRAAGHGGFEAGG
jgi:hypothetical protein